MTKRIALLLTSLFVFGQNSHLKAQSWDIGLQSGISNYMGEINPGLTFDKSGLSMGVNVKRNFSPHFGLRLDAMYHRVSAADSLNTDPVLKNRNLSFTSPIYELSTTFEIHFFRYIPGSKDYRFTPYVNGGLGFLSFNPRARYKGQLIDLQPLGTEGQTVDLITKSDNRYNLWAFSIPVSLGVKWNVGGFSTLALEAGMRFTTTDYLDDISTTYTDPTRLSTVSGDAAVAMADRTPELGLVRNQTGKARGNPGFNDTYWYINLRYVYTLSKGDCPAFK